MSLITFLAASKLYLGYSLQEMCPSVREFGEILMEFRGAFVDLGFENSGYVREFPKHKNGIAIFRVCRE